MSIKNKKILSIITIILVSITLFNVNIRKVNAVEQISLNNVLGDNMSNLRSITKTYDGGFVVVGYLELEGKAEDCYIAKYNSNNNLIWQHTIGGSSYDSFYSVIETKEHDYIVGGFFESNDGDFQGLNKGSIDGLMIKYDQNGNKLWMTTVSGSSSDYINSVTQVSDGSYIGVGESRSSDGDFLNVQGACFIVKIDQNGNKISQKNYNDNGYIGSFEKVISLEDGFAICGYFANDGEPELVEKDSPENMGLIAKFDNNLNKTWATDFGTSYFDAYARSIKKTPDGGYIVIGHGMAIGIDPNDETAIQSSFANNDEGMLVKFDSNGTLQWIKAYDYYAETNDLFQDVYVENDGYIVVGESDYRYGTPEYLEHDSVSKIIKYDLNGNIIWDKTFDNSGSDNFLEITKIENNYYVLGFIQNNDLDYADKTIKNGVINIISVLDLNVNKSSDVSLSTNIVPTITVSTSTNSINFGNITTLQNNYTQNMTVTVQSNNTYSLSLIASDDFKTTDTTPLVMSIDYLKVTTNGGVEQTMSKTTPVVLANNQPNTNSTIYNIGLKLNTDWNITAGNYNTDLLFNVQQ